MNCRAEFPLSETPRPSGHELVEVVHEHLDETFSRERSVISRIRWRARPIAGRVRTMVGIPVWGPVEYWATCAG